MILLITPHRQANLKLIGFLYMIQNYGKKKSFVGMFGTNELKNLDLIGQD